MFKSAKTCNVCPPMLHEPSIKQQWQFHPQPEHLLESSIVSKIPAYTQLYIYRNISRKQKTGGWLNI